MKLLLINLLALGFLITACSNKSTIRDIDYDLEFEKGKTALSKKKFVRAQEHFNTVVIGASHTELGDDALFVNSQASGTSTNYGDYGWYGGLDEMLPTQKYKLKMANDATLTLTGVPVDLETTPINLTCF